MRLIDYGQWTIVLNVSDHSVPFCLAFKGHTEPTDADYQRYQGSICLINSGSITNSNLDKWAKVDLNGTSETKQNLPFEKAIVTYKHWPF